MDKNIIFTDCFNTVILRKISSNEVLFKWSEKVAKEYLIEPTLIYNLFQKFKLKMSIKNFIKTGESELYFQDVLLKMEETLNNEINFKLKNFVNDSYRLYIETEKEYQFINSEIVEKLKEYKKDNKKIYIVSDFYCSKSVIAEFLENLGIAELFDDIYASCDYKRSKATGRIYKYLIKNLNVDKKQILMMGDHPRVDNFMAKLNGIQAIRVYSDIKSDSKFFKKICKKGVYNKEYEDIFNTYVDNLNFSNHAFPLYLFTKRLYKELEMKNIKNVFFIAREGQFLKKLFDKYCDELKSKNIDCININTHYLYASRNSALCASLRDINEEDFYNLFKSSSSMSVRKFLQTLYFSENEIRLIKKEFEFDVEYKIRNFKKSKEFKYLKENDLFIKFYNEKRNNQRLAFGAYLSSFGVDFVEEGFTIVDIGWNGTMQDLFYKYFDGKIKINGYYVGSNKQGTEHNFKQGLLYDKNNNKLFGNSINKHTVYNYEQICRANHNRCDAYEIDRGKVNIILDTKLKDGEIYKNITAPLQAQIVEKFEKISKLDYKNLSNINVVATKYYYKMVKKKNKNDWDWLFKSQNSHHDNFGDARYPFKIVGQSIRKFAFKLLDMFFIVGKSIKINNMQFKYKK